MKRERRQEASDILDMVRSGIEAGASDEHLIGCVNDVLTCLIHSAAEDEREARARVPYGGDLNREKNGRVCDGHQHGLHRWIISPSTEIFPEPSSPRS